MKPYLFFIFLAIGGVFRAQDIDRMLKSETFSHSGSVSVSTTSVFGQHSQMPFTSVLSANYTPIFWGMALPFNLMFSNQKFAYGHPFNSWRLAPSYRWIRAQIGEVQAQLSPYSLSGRQFRGAMLEVQPDKHWTVSALYGRLNDFRNADEQGQNGLLKRLCYGGKVMYSDSKYSFSGSFFKAKDLENAAANLAPQENVVLNLAGQRNFSKNFHISGEWASSALTKNTQDDDVRPNFRLPDIAGLCLPYRVSTAIYHAYKVNMGAPFLSISYEYVDPNYQNLGTYYSTNDFRNLTINTTQRLRSLAFGGRFGVEHNGLKNQKSNRNKRLVYAGNLSYSGKSRLSAQFHYSNFQTYTRVEQRLTEFETSDPYAHIDTLSFRQVMQNSDLSFAYRLKETETSQQQIQAQVSLQKTSESGQFASTSLNYMWANRSGRNVGVSGFFQNEKGFEEPRSSFGLTTFLGTAFAEKKGTCRISISENINNNRTHQFILKASVGYNIQKTHRFQAHFSQRFGSNSATLLNLSYNYTFGQR